MLVKKKKNQCSHQTEAAKTKAVNLMSNYHQPVTGFGQESNAIAYKLIYFWVLIQPNIFLMLVTSEQEVAGMT